MSRSSAFWFKLINEYTTKTKRFDQHSKKLNILSLADGKYKGEFVIDEYDLNNEGQFHIGLATTLFDITSSHALLTHDNGFLGVSTNIHVSNLQPAFPGDVLLIDTKVSRVYNKLAFVEVDISKKNGGIILHGQHTLFIRPFPDDY